MAFWGPRKGVFSGRTRREQSNITFRGTSGTPHGNMLPRGIVAPSKIEFLYSLDRIFFSEIPERVKKKRVFVPSVPTFPTSIIILIGIIPELDGLPRVHQASSTKNTLQRWTLSLFPSGRFLSSRSFRGHSGAVSPLNGRVFYCQIGRWC